MKTPVVYIVILNYNGIEDTVECIESLNKIEYSNYRIVVVDNDSNLDNKIQLEKFKAFNNVDLIYNSENLGYAGGNNEGIKYAINNGAEYVCVANNDIVVDPAFLKNMVDMALQQTNTGIVCPQIREYYNRDRISYGGGEINYYKGGVTICGINSYDEKVMNTPRSITFGHGCCMLIKKEVLSTVGLLPENYFLYYEDTDYSYRVVHNGYTINYCPSSIIYHKESVSTVKDSPNYQYYFTRNRLMFIKNNLKKKYKICAYPFTFMYILKKILQKKFELENVHDAVYDFIHNIGGKRQ